VSGCPECDQCHFSCNNCGKMVDVCKLRAELAEAQRQVEFWRGKAEERGDEIKRIYTEQSHKEDK
jgi:hypothetical protein